MPKIALKEAQYQSLWNGQRVVLKEKSKKSSLERDITLISLCDKNEKTKHKGESISLAPFVQIASASVNATFKITQVEGDPEKLKQELELAKASLFSKVDLLKKAKLADEDFKKDLKTLKSEIEQAHKKALDKVQDFALKSLGWDRTSKDTKKAVNKSVEELKEALASHLLALKAKFPPGRSLFWMRRSLLLNTNLAKEFPFLS